MFATGLFPCGTSYRLWAVFDGHVSWAVSAFAQQHYHRIFREAASVTVAPPLLLSSYNLLLGPTPQASGTL